MRRLMLILVVTGFVFVFEGIDPAFARYHRDAPLGGFSIWQILVGGFLPLVIIGVFAGGSGRSKEGYP